MVAYSFYVQTYHGGSIPEEEWPRYEAQAAAQLARYRRAYTVAGPAEGAEEMAVCAMADTAYYLEEAQNGGAGPLASASIGSVSESRGAAAGVDLSPAGQERALFSAACRYLDIYRGVAQCWR